jgi:hypothetical protein
MGGPQAHRNSKPPSWGQRSRSSQRGFFLVNSPDRVEDGRFDQQQGAAFAGASLRGQFGFYLSGYDTQTPPLVSKLGVIAFDGQGTATFQDYLVNRGGVTTRKGGLSGNYNVTANGRISASVPGVTQTLIGYLINVNSGISWSPTRVRNSRGN